jgi:hypothetical protein
VVGAQHAVATVAEIAAPDQEQLPAGFVVALEQRQDRHAGGGRVELDQGQIDRRGRRGQAARIDNNTGDPRRAAGDPDPMVTGNVGGVSTQRWATSVPAPSPSKKVTIDGQSASSTRQSASRRSCRTIRQASDHPRRRHPNTRRHNASWCRNRANVA